jgi:hypothetical protein
MLISYTDHQLLDENWNNEYLMNTTRISKLKENNDMRMKAIQAKTPSMTWTNNTQYSRQLAINELTVD